MSALVEHVLFSMLVCVGSSFAATILLIGRGLSLGFLSDMARAEVAYRGETLILVPVRTIAAAAVLVDFGLRFGQVAFDRASMRRVLRGQWTAQTFELALAPLLGVATLLAQAPVDVVLVARCVVLQTTLAIARRQKHTPTVVACVLLLLTLHGSRCFQLAACVAGVGHRMRWETWWTLYTTLVAVSIAINIVRLHDLSIERHFEGHEDTQQLANLLLATNPRLHDVPRQA